MQLSTILSTIALALAAVNALPTADAADDGLEKRQVADVLQLWSAYCYAGQRYESNIGNGACINLPVNFRNVASSGKVRSGYDCWVYDFPNCRGDNYGITGNDPKFSRLNNKANSFRCTIDPPL